MAVYFWYLFVLLLQLTQTEDVANIAFMTPNPQKIPNSVNPESGFRVLGFIVHPNKKKYPEGWTT